jgi:hypothetical protein
MILTHIRERVENPKELSKSALKKLAAAQEKERRKQETQARLVMDCKFY